MKYVDDPKLLELRFDNGMLILPYYHSRIMDCLNNPLSSANYKTQKSFFFNGIKKTLKLCKGLNKIGIKKKRILGISNAGCRFMHEGAWKNIRHGYYYDLYPNDFLMVEAWDSNKDWKYGKYEDNFSTIFTYIIALSDCIAFICSKLRPVRRNDFCYISKKYPFITPKQLSFDDYFICVFSFFFNKFIDYVKPHIILLVSGSYGNIYGVICKIARNKGIYVIDTQHGQVYQHKAYSASNIVKESKEYQQYLPDYLYSYGDYWSKCVDWNYDKISVGNPYLNEFVNQFSNIEKTIDYLIIAQPYGKDLQYQFVKALSEEFRNSKIVVRLHPGESLEYEKQIFMNDSNVEIVSSARNLYYEMCMSQYIIGWCSTCLSELLAFGRQPIIVRNSMSEGFFPEDLGIWINNPKDLRKIGSNKVDNVQGGDFWHQNFKDTVKSHLDSILDSNNK